MTKATSLGTSRSVTKKRAQSTGRARNAFPRCGRMRSAHERWRRAAGPPGKARAEASRLSGAGEEVPAVCLIFTRSGAGTTSEEARGRHGLGELATIEPPLDVAEGRWEGARPRFEGFSPSRARA